MAKNWKWLVIPWIGCGLVYVGYGLLLAPQTFFNVIMAQATRANMGPMTFFQGVERLFFKGFPLDGWWTGGWVALALLSAQPAGKKVFTAAAVFGLFALLLGGDNNTWYFLPLGAFFMLAWAGLWVELLKKPSVDKAFAVFVFCISSRFFWGYSKFNPGAVSGWIWRGLGAAIIGGAFVMSKTNRFNNKYTKVLWAVLGAVIIYRLYLWNWRSVLYIMQNWEGMTFPQIWTGVI